MKKTVAALALLASASTGHAMPMMGERPQVTNVCVETYQHKDGSVGTSCDNAENNKRSGVKLLANGCAEGQVSINIIGAPSPIRSCLPPGYMQL